VTVLVIDNYDSFVHNLARYFRELGRDVDVLRNDAATIDAIAAHDPTHLVVSPGPCTPNEAGHSLAAIRHFAGRLPILGVCLGHQCIGQAFGGRVIRAGRPMHGKTSRVAHDGRGLFAGLPNPVTVTRYHSLAVERDSLPACLEATAASEDDEIMALRHRELAVMGVQFHPEAVLTEAGHALLANFLAVTDAGAPTRPAREDAA
jgi:anthranilate synthase/aminodeoxychorismate synthase-like glutamine amidotransferase